MEWCIMMMVVRKHNVSATWKKMSIRVEHVGDTWDVIHNGMYAFYNNDANKHCHHFFPSNPLEISPLKCMYIHIYIQYESKEHHVT